MLLSCWRFHAQASRMVRILDTKSKTAHFLLTWSSWIRELFAVSPLPTNPAEVCLRMNLRATDFSCCGIVRLMLFEQLMELRRPSQRSLSPSLFCGVLRNTITSHDHPNAWKAATYGRWRSSLIGSGRRKSARKQTAEVKRVHLVAFLPRRPPLDLENRRYEHCKGPGLH